MSLSRRSPLRAGLVLTLVMAGGVALAKEEAKDPDVRARMGLMQDLKTQSGILADMAVGKTAYDAAAAEAALEALRGAADKVETAFKPRADDPASDALPDIWNSPAEFRQKTNRLVKVTQEADASAAGALADTMPAVAAACKDCHGRFKM